MRKIKENSKPREFAYSIVDTYDHYDFRSNMIHKSIGSGCGDKFEAETENNCDLALRRIYRLMQLFCESGNKEMKWFLLVQTD